jgi:DMSO/TMAO reductase YedYZ molybdopterin-dependent catalytic subunit
MRRGLPISTARDPNVMLVWEMNGEPLPAAHGGPVRLLVPRWGGIASTKWIVELQVTDAPFVGPYQGDLYVLISPTGEKLLPVREMPVKSIVTNLKSSIPAGPTEIKGYAWSGYGRIERVEVSLDGGETWADAALDNSAGPLAWASFSYLWNATPGMARIQTRATDQRGLTQPVNAVWNEKGYQMNAIQQVESSKWISPSRSSATWDTFTTSMRSRSKSSCGPRSSGESPAVTPMSTMAAPIWCHSPTGTTASRSWLIARSAKRSGSCASIRW